MAVSKKTMLRSDLAERISVKANRVAEGLEPDDYTNHFQSHFGFYDRAPDHDRAIATDNISKHQSLGQGQDL